MNSTVATLLNLTSSKLGSTNTRMNSLAIQPSVCLTFLGVYFVYLSLGQYLARPSKTMGLRSKRSL